MHVERFVTLAVKPDSSGYHEQLTASLQTLPLLAKESRCLLHPLENTKTNISHQSIRLPRSSNQPLSHSRRSPLRKKLNSISSDPNLGGDPSSRAHEDQGGRHLGGAGALRLGTAQLQHPTRSGRRDPFGEDQRSEVDAEEDRWKVSRRKSIGLSDRATRVRGMRCLTCLTTTIPDWQRTWKGQSPQKLKSQNILEFYICYRS